MASTASAPKTDDHRRHRLAVVVHGVALGASCLIAFWLTTHLLGEVRSISGGDDLLGGTRSVQDFPTWLARGK